MKILMNCIIAYALFLYQGYTLVFQRGSSISYDDDPGFGLYVAFLYYYTVLLTNTKQIPNFNKNNEKA